MLSADHLKLEMIYGLRTNLSFNQIFLVPLTLFIVPQEAPNELDNHIWDVLHRYELAFRGTSDAKERMFYCVSE